MASPATYGTDGLELTEIVTTIAQTLNSSMRWRG
jgi:hypothetical protein